MVLYLRPLWTSSALVIARGSLRGIAIGRGRGDREREVDVILELVVPKVLRLR